VEWYRRWECQTCHPLDHRVLAEQQISKRVPTTLVVHTRWYETSEKVVELGVQDTRPTNPNNQPEQPTSCQSLSTHTTGHIMLNMQWLLEHLRSRSHRSRGSWWQPRKVVHFEFVSHDGCTSYSVWRKTLPRCHQRKDGTINTRQQSHSSTERQWRWWHREVGGGTISIVALR
jgi:hypothetical protein